MVLQFDPNKLPVRPIPPMLLLMFLLDSSLTILRELHYVSTWELGSRCRPANRACSDSVRGGEQKEHMYKVLKLVASASAVAVLRLVVFILVLESGPA